MEIDVFIIKKINCLYRYLSKSKAKPVSSLFDDEEEEEDLFGMAKPAAKVTAKVKVTESEPRSGSMFGNDDDDQEDALFDSTPAAKPVER